MENSPLNNGGALHEQKKPSIFTNPVLKKLSKINEVASNEERAASYGGIGFKTAYFLTLTVIGVFTFMSFGGNWDFNSEAFAPSLSSLVVLLLALVFTIITPIVAWLVRPLIPVFGSIYSFSQGYLIGFSVASFGGEYTNLLWLALLITIVIVLTMYILYAKRIIKVTKKFKSVVATLFFTSIFASLGTAILSFVPATSGIVTELLKEPVFTVVGGIVMIVIAALFLLSDFDAIEQTVERRLPKKYEWAAAYGLAFTVIWLYLKVLNLLMSAQNKK